MSDLGLITKAGLVWKAQTIAGEVAGGLTWIAIGTGNWADKLNPPLESTLATGLASEYGRKRISRVRSLELDEINGTIIWNGHKYKEALVPTAIKAYSATFTEQEAIGVGIAELGVFGGTVITTASPLALAAQVTQPGTLYWVQHRPIFVKTGFDTYEVTAFFEER